MGEIAIIGIAKKLEEIYFPGDSVPLYLDKRSENLKVIQQLRNKPIVLALIIIVTKEVRRIAHLFR